MTLSQAIYAQQKPGIDVKTTIGKELQKFPGFDTISMQKLVAIKKKYGIPFTYLATGWF